MCEEELEVALGFIMNEWSLLLGSNEIE